MNKAEIAESFTRFVGQHKAIIYSVCYMFADTLPEADDLFQEVLIKLWQGFDTIQSSRASRSWVYRVSLNTCISDKRKKRVKTVPLDISPDVFDTSSPEGRQNMILHDRITRLEKFDRAIVLLWLEDMSYDEIGAIVGLSAKAVGVRLVRIKEKLRSM